MIETIDPLPSMHRIMLDRYIEAERIAARVQVIVEWTERPAARLARRMRRAFRLLEAGAK
jgi:hypothetical protein